MVEPLPKWLMIRYSKLWSYFNGGEFDFKEARDTLREKNDKLLLVIISELKKYGWLKVKQNSKDKRKSIYKLEKPEIAVLQMVK